MKYRGLKVIYFLIIISIAFIFIDIILIYYRNYIYNSILICILVAVIPICCILTIVGDIGIPTVIFDGHSKTIRTIHIKDERKAANKADYATKMGLLFETIYFDEIVSADVNNKTLTITLQSGYQKVLYLTYFTKKQVYSIANNIIVETIENRI